MILHHASWFSIKNTQTVCLDYIQLKIYLFVIILGLQNTLIGRLSLPVSFLSKCDCMSKLNEFSNYLNKHLLGPAVKCLADSLLYQLAALPRWSYNCCFIINRFLLRRKEWSFKKQYKQAGHLRIWEKSSQ